MKFGHSGTKKGMIKPQQYAFIEYVAGMLIGEDEWGQGCCVGSDEQGLDMVHNTLRPDIPLHYFPPTKKDLTFSRILRPQDVMHEAEHYIERNHSLVDWSDYMFFTPSSMSENLRSGTWATYRYAVETKKPYTIIFPDGKIGRLK